MTPSLAGRLLCLGIRGADPGDDLLEHDLDTCARAGVGAVILFDVDVPTGGPRNVRDREQVAALVTHIRRRLGPDVLVTIDQEGGRATRLNPRHGFAVTPTAEEFAALDTAAQSGVAAAQAQLLRDLDIDLNFAPCVDLALEPSNQIIVGYGRSYGGKPEQVIRAARSILDAHAGAGVGACLKHFPGHGSSRGDTHLGVVDITDTWRCEDELTPYRALAGCPGVAVMVGHLLHREMDAERPAVLSHAITTGLLRGDLGFDGVIVTDSIDMRAISDRWSPAEAAVLAVEAGADLVVDGFNLLPDREHPAVELATALATTVSAERLAESVGRLDRLRAEIGRPA
ncbi:MAG: glycoside hydrolase family 3 protein [bacterium]|nr:glycoside hydrolase family 3 protein [bacterium]